MMEFVYLNRNDYQLTYILKRECYKTDVFTLMYVSIII